MAAGRQSIQMAHRPILSKAMPANDWDTLIGRGRLVTFAKGQTILGQGADDKRMYLVRQGRVEISITSVDGHKSILNQMGAGEILGEIALLDGGARSADAIAASKTVDLTAIEQADVLQALNASPEVALAVIRELCRRVRNASDMFEVKSEKSAKVRLARTMLRLSAKWGQAVAAIPGARELSGFSQGDLGDFAGLARENVNRQMKAWEDTGLIARSETGFTLLDLDAIADQAQL